MQSKKGKNHMLGQAENQANVKFSYKKYYSFRNKINKKFSEKFRSDMRINFVQRALMYGDTQPALVVSVDPLLVAAYSDEMDAVIMLRFPTEFVDIYNLSVGTRLTTSNIYYTELQFAKDIFVGEDYLHNYVDFIPFVQLFIGKHDDKIAAKVKLFSEDVWSKVEGMADDYLRNHPGLYRDGFFYFSTKCLLGN